jgi:polyhydroxyalkanoate synthesis repressor PhaR
MLVKKYSNRRLYDMEASRYVTLEELADKIRAGSDARVVDAKTNEDLTQQTLTQIILEGRGAAKLLPVPILIRLVRLGDDALAEFFAQYVAWALDVYLQVKQGASALGALSPFGNPFGAGFNVNPFARMMGMGPWGESAAAPPPPPPPVAPAPRVATESELDVLRRELDALKRSVGGAKRRARKK